MPTYLEETKDCILGVFQVAVNLEIGKWGREEEVGGNEKEGVGNAI